MPMPIAITAISGKYPDIAVNKNRNIFEKTILPELYKP
jgi:hypothetical protein